MKELYNVEKINTIIKAIKQDYKNRAVTDFIKRGLPIEIFINTKIENKTLWITFSNENENHSINIPLPFIDNGIILINQNEVERPVCSYLIEEKQTTLDYLDAMYYLICDNPRVIIPKLIYKKTGFIKSVIYGFENGTAAIAIHNMQRIINTIINELPLHKTNMNSLVINNRIKIIDPLFDNLTNPEEKLTYQTEKSKKYFPWTSIGLSDGTMADKNYILKTDLRRLSPFGLKMHNPARNLYSTLGMQGDETPLLNSKSTNALMKSGITRTGWNWLTVFVDVPDVWEDQIMLDESHANKIITYKKRFQCFNELCIKKGDLLKEKQILSISKDGTTINFNTIADKALVHNITTNSTNIGGIPTPVYNVTVIFERKIKEGTKITNLAANKGVIRFKKLGYATNPATGKLCKIDVISSSTAINKRKNYTQIIEALVNNINGGKPMVYEDDIIVTNDSLEKDLISKGYPKDGGWECDTCYGKFRAITGLVFWGVTHDIESTIWAKKRTTQKNIRGLRKSGLKFSHVEIRALETRFGKGNPLIDEILLYAQGSEDLHEQINVLKSKKGLIPENTNIINVQDIQPVDQTKGTITNKENFIGTISDKNFLPNGFALHLPIKYQVVIGKDNNIKWEGVPMALSDDILKTAKLIVVFDKIYIPSINLRRSWKHTCGKFGLNDVSAALNNIIGISHSYIENPENADLYIMLYKAVTTYFRLISNKLGSKRGDINTYGMSVRYPHSVKGKATLSNNLPKNTIEIHRDMAKELEICNNDVVLVERFPCLGFMSIRPQKIKITDDPNCLYTIRVSKNSLGSLSLDFDGDDIYIAAFYTSASKDILNKEWKNPNKSCYDNIKILNLKAGVPKFKPMLLREYNINVFDDLTSEHHAEIVGKLVGVKSNTGPVIAFAYNIMRIIENSNIKHNTKTNVAIEVFLDKVGNSVFKQKHGGKSLHSIVIRAICTGNVGELVNVGFERGTSTIICNTIKEKASSLNITNDLESYHNFIEKVKASNIISRIVREENKIYYTSRCNHEGCFLLHHLNQPAVDVPSRTLQLILSGKTK